MKPSARCFSLLPVLWTLTAAASPEPVEAFTDKGEVFMHAGSKQGIRVGSEVAVLGEAIANTTERRVVGKAKVVEVFDTVARLQPVRPMSKLVDVKWVRPIPRVIPTLKGHASISGFGPARRVTVYNESPTEWTRCDVQLPPNRHYVLGTLKANDSEGILWHRFVEDGSTSAKNYDGVRVTCKQGSAQWRFSD